jgi:16S rRNA C1402 N4-methylase RsmH
MTAPHYSLDASKEALQQAEAKLVQQEEELRLAHADLAAAREAAEAEQQQATDLRHSLQDAQVSCWQLQQLA